MTADSHLTRRLHRVSGYWIDTAGCPGSGNILLRHTAKGIDLRVNHPAALVWSLCDGQRTLDDIVSLLGGAYATDAYSVRAIRVDVEQAVQTLLRQGALQWIASTGYDIPILLYHKVAEVIPPGNSLWISQRRFAAQMASLSASGYNTVSFQDFLAYRHGLASPPARPVILTFDDGYADIIRLVRPILDRYGFTATIFLITNVIGKTQRMDNFWDPPEAHYGAEMLLWSEVSELAAAGYEFGAHTQSHPWLNAISLNQGRREIAGSAADLRGHLGVMPRIFAYPFGDGAGVPRIETLVLEAGFAAAVSTRPGIANTLTSDIWALPRIKITEAHTLPPEGDNFSAQASSSGRSGQA